jgi:1-acyl-sn-glycerol-3-phosphate acyltransferase
MGRENLPSDDRSFVMISNHASHLDVLCLLSALPRASLDRAYPVAAEDYFFANLPRLAAATIFVNAIPFGRQSHVRSSMDRCRRLLRARGNKLIIFPEGTRSTDGRVAPFRTGIGNLLAGLDVPAVPCAIVGANRALPKGAIVPRPRKLRLIIGSPRSFKHVEPGRDASHAISRELQQAVEDLLCA